MGLFAVGAVSACLLLSETGVSRSVYGEDDMVVQGDSGLEDIPTEEESASASTAPSQVDGLFELTGEVSDSTGGSISSKEKKNEKKLIVGYKQVGVQASIHFEMGEKPSLDSLLLKFPSQLDVYFLGEKKPKTLPVTWACYGDDYSATNLNYYFFTPTFDETKYAVKGLDLQTESPYIEVVQDAVTYEMIDSAPPKENEAAVFQYCTEKLGLNTAAACGVLANIYCESGFRTNAIGDGGTSVGICQWHNGRWTNLKNYAPDDWQTLEGQLRFMKKELRTGYSDTLNYLKEVSDDEQGAYDAAYYWCMHFEMPDKIVSRSTTRGYLAKNVYWKRYGIGEDETETEGFLDDETEAETELSKDEGVQEADMEAVETGLINETAVDSQMSGSEPEKSDASTESEKPDATAESEKSDASIESEKPDATTESEKSDTGTESEKSVTSTESEKSDSNAESKMSEKKSGNKKNTKTDMDDSYAGIYRCISDNGLNIREKCSTESDVAGFIPYEGKAEVFAGDGEWVKVKYGDMEGFSKLEFLEKIEDETETE